MSVRNVHKKCLKHWPELVWHDRLDQWQLSFGSVLRLRHKLHVTFCPWSKKLRGRVGCLVFLPCNCLQNKVVLTIHVLPSEQNYQKNASSMLYKTLNQSVSFSKVDRVTKSTKVIAFVLLLYLISCPKDLMEQLVIRWFLLIVISYPSVPCQ